MKYPYIIKKLFCPKPTPIVFITPYVEKIWKTVNSREEDFRNASKSIKSKLHENVTFFENYIEAYKHLKTIYTNQNSLKETEIDSVNVKKYPLNVIIEETGYEHSVAYNEKLAMEFGIAPDKRPEDYFSKFESKWWKQHKTWPPFKKMSHKEFHNKLEQEIFKQAPNFLKEINFHYISEYRASMLAFFQNHNIERIAIETGNDSQTKDMKHLVQRLNKKYFQI